MAARKQTKAPEGRRAGVVAPYGADETAETAERRTGVVAPYGVDETAEMPGASLRPTRLLYPAELRRWGDWGAEQICSAEAGTEVSVLRDCGDGWIEVVLGGQSGFLRSEILEG